MIDSRLHIACMGMFAYMQDSVAKVADTFRTGRKRERTKAQIKKDKLILSEQLEERRYRLLRHQTMSFKRYDRALERIYPQVKILTPAAKRNIKAGILGKNGGLRT